MKAHIFLLLTSLYVLNLSFAADAQKLKSKRYSVCGQSLLLEVAESPEERAIGMMHRSGVEETKGMLFVFNEAQTLSFWMKNVPFDLDIGYFDRQGKLITFHTMKGTSPLTLDQHLPTYSSLKPALYAVETKAGFFKRLGSKTCKLKATP